MAWLGRIGKRAHAHTSVLAPVSPHARTVAADPYSFQASHRRLAWMLRLSAGTNIVLGAGVVVLVQTIGHLVPLKETEIALVRTYGPDDRTYIVEPVSKKVGGFEVFLEAQAKRFVLITNEIDPVTQEERQREASRLSDGSFWERFKRERIDSGLITEALEKGIEREVRIVSIDPIATLSSDHKYAVDFIQIDHRRGKEISRKKLLAYLTLATRQQNVSEADKYTNPFGVTVLDMVLRERGAS
ncbi:type IV secretion system protein [Thalassospira sp.]|uniref:type IV secretion system protein n=1 Tax=Thalassospira sp. TaxID=1912094 RepID=UPI0032EBEA36